MAQPVATDRDNLSQAGPKPVGVAAKKTRDGRLDGAAEQSRIRTLNATRPRKALRPRASSIREMKEAAICGGAR